MRQEFARQLYEQMKTNRDIWLLVGDLGYGLFDKIRDDFPDRFINTGAAEQALLDIACGLALENKIPFCYSITPFLIYRPFETLRTYINRERLNVKLIGSGRDNNYEIDGYSHDATDIPRILATLENIEQFYPNSQEEVKVIVSEMVNANKPQFLSLER